MLIEAPVFDDFECRGEQRRYLLRFDDQAIFSIAGKNTADQKRIESHNGQVICADSQSTDLVAVKLERKAQRRLQFIPELKCTRDDFRMPLVATKRAGLFRAIVRWPITESLQLALEFTGLNRKSGIKFQRSCINLGRQVPAPAFEFSSDVPVKIKQVQREYDKQRNACRGNRPSSDGHTDTTKRRDEFRRK